MRRVCNPESQAPIRHFEHHDYQELLNRDDGCLAGCCAGILVYRQTAFIQGGVHEDQEGFYVLEGHGRARVGEAEFPIAPGTAFLAPPGIYHTICRDPDSVPVKLFFFHAAAGQGSQA